MNIILLYLSREDIMSIFLSIHDITLVNDHIILHPPRSNDLEGLSDEATDVEIWKNPYAFFPKVEDISIYLQNMIKHDESFMPLLYKRKLAK